jgi:hypothetical protein
MTTIWILLFGVVYFLYAIWKKLDGIERLLKSQMSGGYPRSGGWGEAAE